MSTGQADRQEAGDKAAFETRDFTSPAFCAARATTSSTYAPKAVSGVNPKNFRNDKENID